MTDRVVDAPPTSLQHGEVFGNAKMQGSWAAGNINIRGPNSLSFVYFVEKTNQMVFSHFHRVFFETMQ